MARPPDVRDVPTNSCQGLEPEETSSLEYNHKSLGKQWKINDFGAKGGWEPLHKETRDQEITNRPRAPLSPRTVARMLPQ